MTKKLDISAVENELKTGSAFFPGFHKPEDFQTEMTKPPLSPIEPPDSSYQEVPRRPDERPFTTPPIRPKTRTDVRRYITRYAFEFYHDQVETLQKWALEEKFAGEKGSMSEMVRQAIDDYIARRKQEDARTGV